MKVALATAKATDCAIQADFMETKVAVGTYMKITTRVRDFAMEPGIG